MDYITNLQVAPSQGILHYRYGSPAAAAVILTLPGLMPVTWPLAFTMAPGVTTVTIAKGRYTAECKVTVAEDVANAIERTLNAGEKLDFPSLLSDLNSRDVLELLCGEGQGPAHGGAVRHVAAVFHIHPDGAVKGPAVAAVPRVLNDGHALDLPLYGHHRRRLLRHHDNQHLRR